MSVGERVTLARRAPGETLTRLCADLDGRVVAAALDNPRLTEERLLPLVQSPKSDAAAAPADRRPSALGGGLRGAPRALPQSAGAARDGARPAAFPAARGPRGALAAAEAVPALVRFEAGQRLESSSEALQSTTELFDLETPEA